MTRRLFLVAPMGRRSTHLGEVDFDAVYRNVVRPAAANANFEALRIDDIVTVGSITDNFVEELVRADLVVADVSLHNPNVFYEIGIRHAISPGGIVLIALDESSIPFDIGDQRVHFYSPAPEGLVALQRSLEEILRKFKPGEYGSRVHSALARMAIATDPLRDALAFERDMLARVERANGFDQLQAVWMWAKQNADLPLAPILALAHRLAELQAWKLSVEVLNRAAAAYANDYEVRRTLGWHLRQLGNDQAVEREFEAALHLNPSDTETLGMLGGLFKRRGQYLAALDSYERGFKIAPQSPYMRTNVAALRILVAPTSPDAGIELYRQIVEDYETGKGVKDEWSQLVCAEAYFALGDEVRAGALVERLIADGCEPQKMRSASDQLELFRRAGFREESASRLENLLRIAASAEVVRAALSPDRSQAQFKSPPPVFLHLSDIHFGSIVRGDVVREMHRFRDAEYEQPLHAHLARDFGPKGRFANLRERLWVVLSGDLTYRAEPQEFYRVGEFLRALCEELQIPPERVVIVPGNHDVHWPTAKDSPTRKFEAYLTFLVKFYGEDLFRKRFPSVKWNFRVDSDWPSPSDIVFFAREDGVMILGLNSAVKESNAEHWGYVGGRQLRNAEDLVSALQADDACRVAVFHHHLHPIPEPADHDQVTGLGYDPSTIRDAGIVERWLQQRRFDLLLHGHKHKPQMRETLIWGRNDARQERRPLIVCGAGSAGVNGNELEHHVPNHYGIITVERLPRTKGAKFIRVEWRELALSPGAEWTSSDIWTLSG